MVYTICVQIYHNIKLNTVCSHNLLPRQQPKIILQLTVNKINVILLLKKEIWIQQTGEIWAIKMLYPLFLAFTVSDLHNSFVLLIHL